jgi:hypothetical protein
LGIFGCSSARDEPWLRAASEAADNETHGAEGHTGPSAALVRLLLRAVCNATRVRSAALKLGALLRRRNAVGSPLLTTTATAWQCVGEFYLEGVISVNGRSQWASRISNRRCSSRW